MRPDYADPLVDMVRAAETPWAKVNRKVAWEDVRVGDAIRVHPSGMRIVMAWATIVAVEPDRLLVEDVDGRTQIRRGGADVVWIQARADTFPRTSPSAAKEVSHADPSS